MITHIVARRFHGEILHLPGELVDATAWRQLNVTKLVNQGRLDFAPIGADPIQCKCGRLWFDVSGIKLHGCKRATKRKEVN